MTLYSHSRGAPACQSLRSSSGHARSPGSSSSMWASSMQSCLVDAVQVCRGAAKHRKQQHRRLSSSSLRLSFATAMNIVIVLCRLVDVYRQARAQTGAATEHQQQHVGIKYSQLHLCMLCKLVEVQRQARAQTTAAEELSSSFRKTRFTTVMAPVGLPQRPAVHHPHAPPAYNRM